MFGLLSLPLFLRSVCFILKPFVVFQLDVSHNAEAVLLHWKLDITARNELGL